MTEAEKELIALRLWKEDALEALAEYRTGEEKNFAMIKEMHEVIVQISDTAHQQQMALSKYIEVKADYFAPKRKKPKVSNGEVNRLRAFAESGLIDGLGGT